MHCFVIGDFIENSMSLQCIPLGCTLQSFLFLFHNYSKVRKSDLQQSKNRVVNICLFLFFINKSAMGTIYFKAVNCTALLEAQRLCQVMCVTSAMAEVVEL